MDTDQHFGLQVIICSGRGACERAVAGFGLALAAAASGTKVVILLTMHGAEWAIKTNGNQVDVPGFSSIAEYIDLIQNHGGRIELCATCLKNACMLQGIGDGKGELRDGIHQAGLTSAATRTEHVPTVTY